jgi:hypothetical protein
LLDRVRQREHETMSTRVLVSLQPGTDPTPVAAELRAIGVESIQPPQPELPDVCIAVIDETRIAPPEWIARASQVPGVENAEVDQLRFTD